MNIREATTDVLDEAVRLEQTFPSKERWSEAAWAEELRNPSRVALVACAHEIAVGILLLAPGPDVTDLLRIIVADDARRLGVAERLLAAGFERCPGRWLLEVREDNEPARNFYEKHGFCVIDRRRDYYGEGLDAIIYERKAD